VETELHKELKNLYAGDTGQIETKVGKYRIDVLQEDLCIEIQVSSLRAFQKKIKDMLKEGHRILVVKPMIQNKKLIRQDYDTKDVISSRMSPIHKSMLSIYEEMVHFREIFPHPNLEVEVLLIDAEKIQASFRDPRNRLHLSEIKEVKRFKTLEDLMSLFPVDQLPKQFTTTDVNEVSGSYMAQSICYCLYHMNGFKRVGKKGRYHLYEVNNEV
jgi:hypothetical protein